MKPGVFITVDVECSMGGAWNHPERRPVPPRLGMMGCYGDRQLGVPLLADILTGDGLQATFFVEPFNDELGYPGQTEPVCAHLLERKQDVQLHVHPGHWHYGKQRQGLEHPRTDQIGKLSPEQQYELLEEGCRRLKQWTGRRPVAFRAGNMGASEETLKQLARAGVRIDSSYSFPFLGGQCLFETRERFNGSRWFGDVLELALTGFTQAVWIELGRAKVLDPMGVSFEECRDCIVKTCQSGADAVLILHSFSLFKVRNSQYEGGKPNHIVERRVRRLCRWLADSASAYPTWTFTQLASAIEQNDYQARSSPPCRLAHPRALVRKAVQAVNSMYWV